MNDIMNMEIPLLMEMRHLREDELEEQAKKMKRMRDQQEQQRKKSN